jgi:hypothetical protein
MESFNRTAIGSRALAAPLRPGDGNATMEPPTDAKQTIFDSETLTTV